MARTGAGTVRSRLSLFLALGSWRSSLIGTHRLTRTFSLADTTLLREPVPPSASPDATPAFVLLDDERVDRLSSAGAQAAALRDAETTAYLLFFQLKR